MVRRGILTPDTAYVKLKWTEEFQTYSGTIAGNEVTYYRANSLYDPQYAAGGTSVEGLGWYAQTYQQYCVLGAKIRVTFIDQGTAANTPRIVGIIPITNNAGIGAATSLNALVSQPYVRYRVLGYAASSRSMCTLQSYMSTKKICGQPNITSTTGYSGSTGGAAVGSNPSVPWFFTLFVHKNDTQASQVSYQVQMTFYCKFYDRINYAGN